MSQEIVETMRRSVDAFDRRDKAAWLAFRDPDCEVLPVGYWPEAGAIHGREVAWDFYVKVGEPFERTVLGDAEVVAAGGDSVLVNHRNEMRGRTSGADVELDIWVVVTFRKGLILRDQWFADDAEALKAAGLSE